MLLVVCTWVIVLCCGTLAVLWVTQLHRLGTGCLGRFLPAPCRNNHFCGGRDQRRRDGFSVSATPSNSRAMMRKERGYLQASLQRRKVREAQTMQSQLRDVREGQSRVEEEQRLAHEQLNARLDKFKRRNGRAVEWLELMRRVAVPTHARAQS